MYSNCCCSCSFEPKIIKIVQSSPNMYSNIILSFQESTILNACTQKCPKTYWRYHVLWTICKIILYLTVSKVNVLNSLLLFFVFLSSPPLHILRNGSRSSSLGIINTKTFCVGTFLNFLLHNPECLLHHRPGEPGVNHSKHKWKIPHTFLIHESLITWANGLKFKILF